MNLKYISKHQEEKNEKREAIKLNELRVFAKKELFAISKRNLSVPIYVGQL